MFQKFQEFRGSRESTGLRERRKPEMLSWLDLSRLCGLMQNLPSWVLVCLPVKWAGYLVDMEGPFLSETGIKCKCFRVSSASLVGQIKSFLPDVVF